MICVPAGFLSQKEKDPASKEAREARRRQKENGVSKGRFSQCVKRRTD